MSRPAPRAVIFGLAGEAPSAGERRLFAAADPLGFILFARNCVEPTQVRALCGELREIVGRTDAPILIDQEGGRVARLRPPHWPEFPPAARFGALARTALDAALEAVRLNARLIAHELAPLGIDVDCLPVLDVPHRGADPVIGDRAFAADPALIARLGRAACEGLRAGGVLPVIKHVPGHGRALVDSHMALPVVDASQEALEGVDFAPFRALADMPWAMTAHVVYAALDPARPATTSPLVIESIIRGALGFDGVLVSDDLCMNALDGSPEERTRASLAAGCDVALHCNGDLAAMTAIAEACPPLTPAAMRRLARANAWRRAPEPFDPAAARARVDALLGSAVA